MSGAVIPDEGEVFLEGRKVNFHSPIDARNEGIETVYQTLAMSPALSIADNMFMGREIRKPGFRGKFLRQLDRRAMEKAAREMKTLSEHTHWPHSTDKVYEHFTEEFRQQCDKLTRLANKKNRDGTHYTFLAVSTTCVNCHGYVRGRFRVPRVPSSRAAHLR